MKNKTRIMSLAASLGLLTVAAVGCGQSSNETNTENTPPQQNSMAPSGADTNAVPGTGMNTNNPATTSTNTP
jgi:hypothetical protein